MTKREYHKRTMALSLAAFGILLWASAGPATFGSVQNPSSVTKRNQNPSSVTKRNQKPVVTTAKSGVLTEEFSFLIKDFKMDHQGENNNLNITISYRYKAHLANSQYPDFMLIARDIETLLTNYPNEEDYWEILNKKITLMVLEKYPAITRITSQMQVSPSIKDPYLRSSIATRGRTSMRKHSRSATAVK